MNRPIEFRGWHKTNGWCGAFSIHQSGFVDYGSGWMNPKDANMIITQFTGLLDKHGKKIFEGDIVRYDSDTKPHIIEYKKNEWCEDGFYSGYLTYFTSDQYEVIGNVFENSELLDRK